MIIPATVNENMVGDICEYANAAYENIKEKKPMYTAYLCSIKGRINEHLQEKNVKSYAKIMAIVDGSEFEEISKYDYELMCFKVAADIFTYEDKDSNTIFDQIVYVEDFSHIYRKICAYFRRIQLEFEENLCYEIVNYIWEKRLSVFAITRILLIADIGEKEKIALKIAEYYAKQGQQKEASYLLSEVENICRDEYKMLMSETKFKYMEI